MLRGTGVGAPISNDRRTDAAHVRRTRRRPLTTLIGISLSAVLVGGACTTAGSGSPPLSSSGLHAASSGSSTIPQPSLEKLNNRTLRRLAPESQRVDLVAPSFSDPTTITNPLFPIGDLRSAVLLGKLHGKPWRAETTLLPDTKIIEWNGQPIETLQSQFVAYLDGRIFEVAVDHYAQADDGSVWYFGEDAFTYERGRVFDTEGTWVAGVDGPPAMIMPGDPQVGQVYRTENIPGLVFEQVTVKSVGETVMGPTGLVVGAMVAQELHMDEVRLEDKYFAPGYGEFFSGGGRTFEATALAVPVDALPAPVPAELEMLSTAAIELFDAARSKDWSAASGVVDTMSAAWVGFAAGGPPERLAAQMSDALDSVTEGVRRREGRVTSQAALDVARASLDLQLRYRPSVDVNLGRFDLWTRQLQSDAVAGDQGSALGDVATLRWIRDRVALEVPDARRVDDDIRFLEAAVEDGRLAVVADAAAGLRETVAGLAPITPSVWGAMARASASGMQFGHRLHQRLRAFIAGLPSRILIQVS